MVGACPESLFFSAFEHSDEGVHVVVVGWLDRAGKGVEYQDGEVFVVVGHVLAAETETASARLGLLIAEVRDLCGEGSRVGEKVTHCCVDGVGSRFRAEGRLARVDEFFDNRWRLHDIEG